MGLWGERYRRAGAWCAPVLGGGPWPGFSALGHSWGKWEHGVPGRKGKEQIAGCVCLGVCPPVNGTVTLRVRPGEMHSLQLRSDLEELSH